MAVNDPLSYGLDIACVSDADGLWTEVSGVDLVAQDALHALTQQDFLGPGGEGRGFDVRTLIGMHAQDLAAQEPILVEVMRRDDRISDASIVLTVTTNSNGLADVQMSVVGETADGPFQFTKNIGDLTAADLEAGDS